MKSECPYFPCSSYGENCKYCYCPFYGNFCNNDERTGGKYIVTKNGYQLWDCSECKYIHRDEIVFLINLDINERRKKKLKKAWNRFKDILP